MSPTLLNSGKSGLKMAGGAPGHVAVLYCIYSISYSNLSPCQNLFLRMNTIKTSLNLPTCAAVVAGAPTLMICLANSLGPLV